MPWLEETAEARLRHARRAAVLASMPVRSAAAVLVTGLNEAGVPCLTYKGTALAAATTSDPSARGAGDLDILVAPQDVPAARDVLEGMGARFVLAGAPDATSPLWPLVRRLNCELSMKWRTTSVDLHWRIDRLPQICAVAFDEMWARRQLVDIGDLLVPTLGTQDALLVTAAHGTKERWRHWRWIVDFIRQSRSVEDWDEVRQVARASGCGLALDVALAMHEQLAPLPASLTFRPSEAAQRLAQQAWRESYERTSPFDRRDLGTRMSHLRWNVRITPSVGALGSVLVRHAWATNDMAEVQLPLAMAWAYPMLRPVLWTRRLLRDRATQTRSSDVAQS